MACVGGVRDLRRSLGVNIAITLATVLVVVACAREPATLAVPEQTLTERHNLQTFGENDVEAILCFIAVGHVNAQCKGPAPEPVLEPLPVVDQKYGPLLRTLEKPELRRMDRFEQAPAVAELIEPVDARVVDAREDRPGTRLSRPAYQVERCWFVFYTTTLEGDPPLEKKEAIFQKLSVFCRHPQQRGP